MATENPIRLYHWHNSKWRNKRTEYTRTHTCIQRRDSVKRLNKTQPIQTEIEFEWTIPRNWYCNCIIPAYLFRYQAILFLLSLACSRTIFKFVKSLARCCCRNGKVFPLHRYISVDFNFIASNERLICRFNKKKSFVAHLFDGWFSIFVVYVCTFQLETRYSPNAYEHSSYSLNCVCVCVRL